MLPIRARDLRANIKEWGFEKGVVVTLEQLLDEFASYRQHMRELTDLAGKCIEQIDRFVTVSDGVIKELDKIKRERKPDDEGTEC